MKSVLQDWVMELSLRKQGVLILALRGMDGARKESTTKPVVRTLRGLVMNSGREGAPMKMGEHYKTDSFMNTRDINDYILWNYTTTSFFSDVDSYNIHFYQHLLHAFAVCGADYPHNEHVRTRCWLFYTQACGKLHMHAETVEELAFRLRDGIRPESDE